MSKKKGRQYPSAFIFEIYLEQYPEKRDSIIGYELYEKMPNAIKVKLRNGKTWLFQISEYGVRVMNHYPVDAASVPVSLAAEENAVMTEPMRFPPEQSVMCARLAIEGRIAIHPSIKKGDTLFWLHGNEIVRVSYEGNPGGCIGCDHKFRVTFLVRTMEAHIYEGQTYKAGEYRRCSTDDIGTEIFFTRDEAEDNKKGARQ